MRKNILCVFCTVHGNQNAQTTDTSPRKKLKSFNKLKKLSGKRKKREILDGPAEGGPGQGVLGRGPEEIGPGQGARRREVRRRRVRRRRFSGRGSGATLSRAGGSRAGRSGQEGTRQGGPGQTVSRFFAFQRCNVNAWSNMANRTTYLTACLQAP